MHIRSNAHFIAGGPLSRWVGVAVCALIVVLAFTGTNLSASAATPPSLGTTSGYAILAGTTVTNTDSPTVVDGDLGLSTGSAVTGFPPGTLTGTYHIDDTAAVKAKSDLAAHQKTGVDASAFTDIAAKPGATYLLPITDHGSEVTNLANPVLQDIFDGKSKSADALPKLNTDINALFK